MIRTLAVEGYRSLRHLVTPLDAVTVVTGPNGSGKTTVYRALRLLADVVREGALAGLAREGGMRSALHAGPRGTGPVAMRLGFSGDDLSYAIDLGLPQGGGVQPFPLDPQIKSEVVWAGPVLRPATTLAERRGPSVRLRGDAGWSTAGWRLADHESLMSALVDPAEAPELFAIRQQATRWRFYDHLRTDADAPARRPGPATFTPVLAPDGADLASALLTIERVGVAAQLHDAVDAAFDARLQVTEDDDGACRVALHQPGVRRPLAAAELSDGTLKFLLLAAALMSPRPPALLVLNEPESSLHPSLMPALAALVLDAAERCQVVVVTHSGDLVRGLRAGESVRLLELSGNGAGTSVDGLGVLDEPAWTWPRR